MNDFEWDVFVSHNLAQKPWVRLVVKQWRDLGLNVFFDEDSIKPGEPIVAGMQRGLKRSRRVVLMLSPESLASPWVIRELQDTVYLDPDASERRLIPVMVSHVDSDQLPELIRSVRYLDLTNTESRCRDYPKLLSALGILQDRQLPCPALDKTEEDTPAQRQPLDQWPLRSKDHSFIQNLLLNYLGSFFAGDMDGCANLLQTVESIDDPDAEHDSVDFERCCLHIFASKHTAAIRFGKEQMFRQRALNSLPKRIPLDIDRRLEALCPARRAIAVVSVLCHTPELEAGELKLITSKLLPEDREKLSELKHNTAISEACRFEIEVLDFNIACHHELGTEAIAIIEKSIGRSKARLDSHLQQSSYVHMWNLVFKQSLEVIEKLTLTDKDKAWYFQKAAFSARASGDLNASFKLILKSQRYWRFVDERERIELEGSLSRVCMLMGRFREAISFAHRARLEIEYYNKTEIRNLVERDVMFTVSIYSVYGAALHLAGNEKARKLFNKASQPKYLKDFPNVVAERMAQHCDFLIDKGDFSDAGHFIDLADDACTDEMEFDRRVNQFLKGRCVLEDVIKKNPGQIPRGEADRLEGSGEDLTAAVEMMTRIQRLDWLPKVLCVRAKIYRALSRSMEERDRNAPWFSKATLDLEKAVEISGRCNMLPFEISAQEEIGEMYSEMHVRNRDNKMLEKATQAKKESKRKKLKLIRLERVC